MCHVDHLYPIPTLACLICWESHIYLVLRNNSSVHSIIVTQSCDTLAPIASSSSSAATSSPFHLSPRKSKLTLFLAVTMLVFNFVPWLSKVVFQLSLEHLWPPLMRSSLPLGHHKINLTWVNLSLMAPLELWGSIWTDPSWFCKIPLDSLFRIIYVYCTYCNSFLLFIKTFCSNALF